MDKLGRAQIVNSTKESIMQTRPLVIQAGKMLVNIGKPVTAREHRTKSFRAAAPNTAV